MLEIIYIPLILRGDLTFLGGPMGYFKGTGGPLSSLAGALDMRLNMPRRLPLLGEPGGLGFECEITESFVWKRDRLGCCSKTLFRTSPCDADISSSWAWRGLRAWVIFDHISFYMESSTMLASDAVKDGGARRLSETVVDVVGRRPLSCPCFGKGSPNFQHDWTR